MVTFATPPCEPNDWLLPYDAAPSSTAPALPAERRRTAAVRSWALTLFALLLAGTAVGVVAQLPTQPPFRVDEFARNRIETQAARLLQQRLPRAPRLVDVRRLMAESELFCRPTLGAGTDSLLTCLGHAVRYDGAYSRMAFRVDSHGDSVTRVVACPALIVHRTAPSATLIERARPLVGGPGCWRDPANPADSDWAWTSLPDSARFTLVPLPDAPRMRVESAPSADTITVVW